MQEMLWALGWNHTKMRKIAENQNAGLYNQGLTIYRSNNMSNKLTMVDLLTSAVYHICILTTDRNVMSRYP
jgi:hypothetical protein